MKPIQIVVYGMIFIASLGWGLALYKLFALPKILSVLASVVLGPASVIMVLYAVSNRFDGSDE
jgi:hypothetical protein